MTLRHLKIFVTVCECNSVTGAAEKLYIAQPSVSLAISELEGYYGVKLFDRISRRLSITEIGKQFLSYATHIVSLFDEMEKGIKNWDTIGTLRVGASITIGNYLLPSYVQNFQKQHSQIKVYAVIDNSETIEKHILNNNIDLALIEGNVHNSQINQHKFMDDELILICGKNHSLSEKKTVNIHELKEQNFILRGKGSAGREVFESILRLHNIEIEPTWESTSTQAIIKAVRAGLGISVLPYLLVKEHLSDRNILQVKINDISLIRQFSVIYHKNKFLTNSAKEFIRLCSGNN